MLRSAFPFLSLYVAYKYTLGESLLEIAWQCLDLVLEVNHLSNEHKFAGLQKLSLSFDRLKLRIRMAQELEIISVRQFTHLQTVYLKEIGEMIGGWHKWAERNR